MALSHQIIYIGQLRSDFESLLNTNVNALFAYESLARHFSLQRHFRFGAAAFFMERKEQHHEAAAELLNYARSKGWDVSIDLDDNLTEDQDWGSFLESMDSSMLIESEVIGLKMLI